MEIVLTENIPSLGFVGDVVKVKRGYARNFLIPTGKALEAGSRNGKVAAHKLLAINAKKIKLKSEAQALVQRLSSIVLEFTARTVSSSSTAAQASNTGGKTYGSITQKEIEAALLEKGFEIDKKLIKLQEPLKTVGTHQVSIKLHADVTGQISVNIISEAPSQTDEDSAKPKRGAASRKPSVRRQAAEEGESTEGQDEPKKPARKSKKAETDTAVDAAE